MKFTKEDIELIEKFIEIKNKGYYADGKQVTDVYNRVLEKNVNVTNCGSCLRHRVGELEDALTRFKKLSEEQAKQEPRPSKGLEDNEVELPRPMKEEENKEPKSKKNKK